MGKNGGGSFLSCLCRPRNPQDLGVVSSKTTVAPTPPSVQLKRRGDPTNFMDDLAVSPFTPEDNSWFRNDDTEPTVEEEEDLEPPFEAAYRFWHSKGLLSFVPDSIKEAQKMHRDENDWATFSQNPGKDAFAARTQNKKQQKRTSCPPTPKPERPLPPAISSGEIFKQSPIASKKLDFANLSNPEKRGKSTINGTPESARGRLATPPSTQSKASIPESGSAGNERRDLKLRSNSRKRSTQVLPPPRSKQEDCASCGSQIVTRVRCVHCKHTVYCSMFCRGNDRYKHASICSKQYCPTSTPNEQATRCPVQESSPSWKKRVSVDEDPQPEAHALRRYWEDRSNLDYSDQ